MKKKTTELSIVHPYFWVKNIKRFLIASVKLTKPGISVFIGFTSATAMLFREDAGNLSWNSQLTIFMSSYLSSAGSAVFNHYYENDVDRLMSRTKNRPIPEGIISTGIALLYSAILLLAGIGIAAHFHGTATASFLAAGAFSYIALYTVISKRRTYWNIPIGGLCGMFAALAGSVSVNGALSREGIAFAVILYLWSSPHFWSLAIVRSDDYQRGGIPMLPVTHGNRKTAYAIMFHALLLPFPALIFIDGYMVASVITFMAGVIFFLHSVRLVRAASGKIRKNGKVKEETTIEYARQSFVYSLMYLPIVYFGFWLTVILDYAS